MGPLMYNYTTSQRNFKNCLGDKNFPLNNMVIKTNISNVDQLQLLRDLQSNERQPWERLITNGNQWNR